MEYTDQSPRSHSHKRRPQKTLSLVFGSTRDWLGFDLGFPKLLFTDWLKREYTNHSPRTYSRQRRTRPTLSPPLGSTRAWFVFGLGFPPFLMYSGARKLFQCEPLRSVFLRPCFQINQYSYRYDWYLKTRPEKYRSPLIAF